MAINDEAQNGLIRSWFQHKVKRLKVWLFLCFHSNDWKRIIVTSVAWLTLVFVVHHQTKTDLAQEDVDYARKMFVQQLNKSGINAYEMDSLSDLFYLGDDHHYEENKFVVEPLPQPFEVNNHSHEHQRKPHNVRRGFYQKGFDVVGGQRDLDPQILNKLREKLNKGPGADGKMVVLEDRGERARALAAFSNWGINIVASHKISVHRALPDKRPEGCKNKDFKLEEEGRNVSVVIVFHDEAWSTLLRTVWSVLHTTPTNLLLEVILVDDFSTRMHLRRKLDKYIKKHFPKIVKLRRLNERQGLIRARLIGARFATAEYLVFLDSHNECADGWMEPLLFELAKSPLAVVAPTMDVIDHDTMEYKAAANFVPSGGFGWDGRFRWERFPLPADITNTVPVPVLGGGIFAVVRKYFWKIGSYDDGMDFWGGESLELSWRVWMCGGSVRVSPCSRVGHVFKPIHAYNFGDRNAGEVLHHNIRRAVIVWTDHYAKFFHLYGNMRFRKVEIDALTHRKRLKDQLNCHNFGWYLKNIYKNLIVPTDKSRVVYFGKVKNAALERFCLVALSPEDQQQHNNNDLFVGQHRCHDEVVGAEYFVLTKSDRIRMNMDCATVDMRIDRPTTYVEQIPVRLIPCNDNDDRQKWKFLADDKSKKGSLLMHERTGKCLDILVGLRQHNRTAFVQDCDELAKEQRWIFDTNHPFNEDWKSV